ncbi:Colicin V production protein [Actinokineospora alba]|uniref:Colicin V production protein n=1 Tax=Actinokineospora alba TaxID=504798 RepID=A0A1H0T0D6_9PSEU|nr:MarP family serine protease [Actinokineospora alba]TDP66439.1 colicin V production protein [Actinokineospora alba]SDJ51751.1 Colicin V production protein [Actinokineospora alba]SDP47434.1 Colicin V production protein [Actinokineospora alba]
MNWVDVLVVALAVLAAISGARQGVITALPAFIGVLLGAIAGIKLAPLVVSRIDSTPTRVAFAVAIFVLLVALGETFGVWIGRTIRQKFSSPRLAGVDSALGAVVQGAVVFVVSWLIALPLTTVGGLPGLSSAIKDSAVLGGVNEVMPHAARGLPNELRLLLDVSGFPAAVDPFNRTPNKEVEPPDPALQASAVVQRVRQSVLKINAKAPSCERALEGSGFVIARERVMTNAHVVAGTDEVSVESGESQLRARVVHYDPATDVAILAVPGLTAPPLPFAPGDAKSGQDAIVLGYPLDGPYTASPARVRDRIPLRGPDIYDSATVNRDVFTLRAKVLSGNSGGPLVDTNGQVVGVIFGAAVDNSETGFALTAAEVREEVGRAPGLTERVGTSRCAS